MPMFQTTYESLRIILNKLINDEPFSAKDYNNCYNAIHAYLNGDEYNNNFEKASAIFNAAEKKRIEQAKKVAAEESKRTGKPIAPVYKDTNEHDIANLPGSQLYFTIQTFLEKYINKIASNEENLQDKSYLKFYLKMWHKFQLVTKILNGLCSTLNKNWIHRQIIEDRLYIYEIDILAMHLWNREFFQRSTTILTEKCLAMINKYRDGERIDKTSLKHVVQSYITVDSSIQRNNTDASAKRLGLYEQHFEKRFLNATEEYYKKLASQYQLNGDTKSYIETILKLIDKEDLIGQYLHDSTRLALRILIGIHLIAVRLKEIQSEAIGWIQSDYLPGLTLAYGLLKRIEQVNDPVAEQFGKYILKIGTETINDCAHRASKDPQLYVETILQIHQRFKSMLEQGFQRDTKFSRRLDQAFNHIVNRNAVAELTRSTKKSAEFFARYLDLVLRRGEKVTDGVPVTEKLSQIMIVFNYINDKDAFQSFYRQSLVKRLMYKTHASDEYEEFMIRKLQEACGYEYTTTIQRMFQDVMISKDFEKDFRNSLIMAGDKRYDNFSLLILGANNWSLALGDKFILPRELIDRMERCTEFYHHKHNGRKLIWHLQQSRCELSGVMNQKDYIFNTSLMQATILLLFNESLSWSIGIIQERTGLAPNLLMSLLLGLIQSKIIQSSNINDDQLLADLSESDLQLDFTIQISPTYRNTQKKINLTRPIKSVEQQEAQKTDKKIEEERLIHTELIIVRVMKTRQTISHADLIQQTSEQLLNRFHPEVSKIKSCISRLIDKEYLRRDEKDRELYHYVAYTMSSSSFE